MNKLLTTLAVIGFSLGSFSVMAQTANSGSSATVGVNSQSGAISSTDGNAQSITLNSEGTDLSRAVPDVGAPSISGGGPCIGAGGSVGTAVAGFGISGGYQSVDEACTVRQNTALMMQICDATNDPRHCMAAESYLRGSDSSINAAYEAAERVLNRQQINQTSQVQTNRVQTQPAQNNQVSQVSSSCPTREDIRNSNNPTELLNTYQHCF